MSNIQNLELLIEAVNNSNLELVKELVSDMPEQADEECINQITKAIKNAIDLAIESSLELQYLVDLTNRGAKEILSPIAALANNARKCEIIKILISKYNPIDLNEILVRPYPHSSGSYCVFDMILRSGNIKLLEMFLDLGVEINFIVRDDVTLLHAACLERASDEVINLILDHYKQKTPELKIENLDGILKNLLDSERVDFFKVMLDLGADIDRILEEDQHLAFIGEYNYLEYVVMANLSNSVNVPGLKIIYFLLKKGLSFDDDLHVHFEDIEGEGYDLEDWQPVRDAIEIAEILSKAAKGEELSDEDKENIERILSEDNDNVANIIEMLSLRLLNLFRREEIDKETFLLKISSFKEIVSGTKLYKTYDKLVYDKYSESNLDKFGLSALVPELFEIGRLDKEFIKEIIAGYNEEEGSSIDFNDLLKEQKFLLESFPELKDQTTFGNFRFVYNSFYTEANSLVRFIKYIDSISEGSIQNLKILPQLYAIISKTKNEVANSFSYKKYKEDDLLEKVTNSLETSLLNSFKEKLEEKNLHLVNVPGEGNCFFHAMARHLHVSHEELRAVAIQYMLENPNQFADFVSGKETDLDGYIDRMSMNSYWADNLVIQALANSMELTIHIYSLNHVEQPTVITPLNNPENGRIVNIAYTGNHYLSIETLNNEIMIDNESEQVIDNNNNAINIQEEHSQRIKNKIEAGDASIAISESSSLNSSLQTADSSKQNAPSDSQNNDNIAIENVLDNSFSNKRVREDEEDNSRQMLPKIEGSQDVSGGYHISTSIRHFSSKPFIMQDDYASCCSSPVSKLLDFIIPKIKIEQGHRPLQIKQVQESNPEVSNGASSYSYGDILTGLKALDVSVDVFKLSYEPTREHLSILVRDFAHLGIILTGTGGYLPLINAVDIAAHAYNGEYSQAFTQAGITAGYMLLPTILGTSLGPVYAASVLTYTGYKLASNIYSAYSNYVAPESQLKSNLAYATLSENLGLQEMAKEYLVNAMQIVIEDVDLGHDHNSPIQDIAAEYDLAGKICEFNADEAYCNG